MTVRASARVAGLALIGAEATAGVTHAGARPPLAVWVIFIALQVVAVVWATDRRSALVLRMIAPALLTAVTATALWTTLALVVPRVANGDAAALVVVFLVGAVVAAAHRGAGRRLPLVLLASAGSALLIFLVISWLLPAVPGFVSNNHPPTYPPMNRLVDPIGELAVSVLLAVALGVDVLRVWIRSRRVAARDRRPVYGSGPNEMVIERSA